MVDFKWKWKNRYDIGFLIAVILYLLTTVIWFLLTGTIDINVQYAILIIYAGSILGLIKLSEKWFNRKKENDV